MSSQHMNCIPVGKHVGTEVWCGGGGEDTQALVLLFFFLPGNFSSKNHPGVVELGRDLTAWSERSSQLCPGV